MTAHGSTGTATAATTTARDPSAVPGAPAIQGIRFRGLLDFEADLPEMVRVGTAARLADDVEEMIDVEGMRATYANLNSGDPTRDVLLVEIDGRLAAYGRIEIGDDSAGVRRYGHFGFVDPAHRRRGIGRAMLHRFVARLREIAVADDMPGRSRLFESFNWDTDVGGDALLRSEGYVPARHFFEMVRPDLDGIETPPLPDGLEVRPVLPEHIRSVFEADAEAFRDHWGAHDASDAAFRRFSEDSNLEPRLWRVAWDGDRIAGVVVNKIDPKQNQQFGYQRGWLDGVAVRRPWRRRGLASALIGQSLVALRDAGMTSAALGVDTENLTGALGLYERAGFRPRLTSTMYEKPFDSA